MSKKWQRSDENGMVSFMVTIIMILVITLIVLGFSQVTRRNQREALDRQLSSEAFYAAESGINVTTHTIQQLVNAPGGATLQAKNSCANNYDGTPIRPLDGATGAVTYTCVLVNPSPRDIRVDPTTARSVVTPIFSDQALGNLTFQWSKQTGATDTSCSGTYQLTASTAWKCGEGVLRVDLMKVPAGGSLNSTTLSTNTVTLFLTPFGNTPNQTIQFGTATTSYVVTATGGTCSTACKATVVLPAGGTQYYARLSMAYRTSSSDTIITGNNGAATFSKVQAVVDVTGKAQDELRRIQARVNLTPTADADTIPLNAVASSESICKVYSFSDPDNDSIAPATTPTSDCN